jgi:hypothetical protein
MCRVPRLPFKDFLLPEVPSFLWLAHGLWPSVWSSPHIWPAGQPSDLYLPNTSSLRNCSARFLAELWLLHNLSVMGVPALWATNYKINEHPTISNGFLQAEVDCQREQHTVYSGSHFQSADPGITAKETTTSQAHLLDLWKRVETGELAVEARGYHLDHASQSVIAVELLALAGLARALPRYKEVGTQLRSIKLRPLPISRSCAGSSVPSIQTNVSEKEVDLNHTPTLFELETRAARRLGYFDVAERASAEASNSNETIYVPRGGMVSKRCGASWDEANRACGKRCTKLILCAPPSQYCFGYLNDQPGNACDLRTPVTLPSPTDQTVRCGTDWLDAERKCHAPCTSIEHCKQSESCWGGLTATACQLLAIADAANATSRCGMSWPDANTKCGSPCFTKLHCSSKGEGCYAGLSVRPCNVTAHSVTLHTGDIQRTAGVFRVQR